MDVNYLSASELCGTKQSSLVLNRMALGRLEVSFFGFINSKYPTSLTNAIVV